MYQFSDSPDSNHSTCRFFDSLILVSRRICSEMRFKKEPGIFPDSLDPILNPLVCFQPHLLHQEVVSGASQHGGPCLEKKIDHLQRYPILHDSMTSFQMQTVHVKTTI